MIEPLKRSKDTCPQAGRRQWTSRAGFTLIELLAVVMVILLLAAIMIGVASYAQKKMAVAAANSLLKYPLKHLNITRAGLSNDHVHCEKESCPI